MFAPKTFLELCTAMQTGAVITLNDHIGIDHDGVVMGIEKGDDAGRVYRVKLAEAENDPGSDKRGWIWFHC
jgi:hypothetical protein